MELCMILQEVSIGGEEEKSESQNVEHFNAERSRSHRETHQDTENWQTLRQNDNQGTEISYEPSEESTEGGRSDQQCQMLLIS